MECSQDGADIAGNARGSDVFNTTIAGIDEADAILIIGSNPRIEAPVMNARIRKKYLASGLPIAYIGQSVDLTYPAEYLGSNAAILTEIAENNHPFCNTLQSANNPMIIVGNGVYTRNDAKALLHHISEIIKTFAFSVVEAIDNLINMKVVEDIVHLTRVDTNDNFPFMGDFRLLREMRGKIDNEQLIYETLLNGSQENSTNNKPH